MTYSFMVIHVAAYAAFIVLFMHFCLRFHVKISCYHSHVFYTSLVGLFDVFSHAVQSINDLKMPLQYLNVSLWHLYRIA
jgi:hypothetical protein